MRGDSCENCGSEISATLHQLFTRIKTPLYAIIDTARDRRAFSVLEATCCDHEILYPPKFAFDMDHRGPHLVSVRPGSTCLELLINAGWGNSWGIYLTSPSDFAAVRRHLQRLLFAKLHDGRRAHFRFYDPRILRDYLPTCREDELDQFFGPLSMIHLESENGREVHCYSRDRSSQRDNPSRSGGLLECCLKLF
jgi:hypothetical protein